MLTKWLTAERRKTNFISKKQYYNMKRALLFLLLMFSTISVCYGQELISIVYGNITDDSGEELVNAKITFKQANGYKGEYSCICDVDGYFQIELPENEYNFVISYMGETHCDDSFHIVANKDSINMGRIAIELCTKLLDEVVVKAARPFVSYNGSNTIYDLAANPAAVGGSLIDGLRLIPGLQIENDNSLSAFGFHKLTVAINGQVLRQSNDEIAAYISTMSVGDIEKVELIRHPGPEYGKNVESVLNILTKKKPNEGTNAFLSSNITYRKLLSEQVSSRLNINKGKWKNHVAYNFTDNRRKEELATSLGNDTTKIKPYRVHGILLGSELQLSANHLVGINTQTTFADEHLENDNTTHIEMKRSAIRSNVYHNLSNKKFTWSSNADYTYIHSNRYFKHSLAALDKIKDNTHYMRVASDFTYRLTPNVSLQTGGIYNYTKVDNNSWQEESKTNYTLHESTLSAYLTLRYQNNSTSAYAGIQSNYDTREIEEISTTDHIRNHIWKWQPYFNVSYQIAPNHRITTNFQTYYTRPYFRDIMSYVSSSSSFLRRKGNSSLGNSTRYNLSFTYTFMNAATFEITLSKEKSPITEILSQSDGNIFISKTNLDHSKYLRMMAGLPLPIIYRQDGMQWMTTTYIAYHVQRDKGVVNNDIYNQLFHAYYIQHKQSLSLPNKWYFDATITFFSPLTAGVYMTKKQWWTDFSISKRMGIWRFSIMGNDIFHTNIARGEVLGLEETVNFRKDWFGPKLVFGVSVTLGNSKLKTARRRNSYIENRVSQSANESISIEKE